MARAVHREVGQHLRHPHHPELPAGTNRTAYVRPQGRSNASCFGNHRETSENSSPISEVIQNHQQEQRRNPRSIFPRHRIPVQLTGFAVICSGIAAPYDPRIINMVRDRVTMPPRRGFADDLQRPSRQFCTCERLAVGAPVHKYKTARPDTPSSWGFDGRRVPFLYL